VSFSFFVFRLSTLFCIRDFLTLLRGIFSMRKAVE